MRISAKESPKYVLGLAVLIWSICFIADNAFRHPDGRIFFWIFDDALISMRYAWHWAHGYGLVWNPGERVEGYTNFLLVALMTPLHWIFSLRYAPLAVQILNLICGMAVAVQFCRLVDDLVRRRDVAETQAEYVKTSALFLLLTYYPFLYWTLLGMEPTLLTFLFLLIARNAVIEPGDRTGKDDLRLAVFHVLALLCRPDSLLFSVPLWLAVAYAGRRKHDLRRAVLVLSAVAFAVVLQTAFRKIYYGEWVPNTFYLKASGLTVAERLDNGYRFLWPFLLQVLPLVGLAIFAAVQGPGRAIARPGLAVLAIVCGYQLWIGGDTFLGLWRFMVPVMPLVMLSAVIFLVGLIFKKERKPDERVATVAAWVGAAALWLNATFLPWLTSFETTPGRNVTYQFIMTAAALEDVLKPGASLGVFSAGVVPYYLPHLRAVDFLGKSDRTIAKSRPHIFPAKGMLTLPGHNKYDLKYSILELKPTWIEHVRWFDDDVTEAAKPIYEYARYQGIGLILLRESPYVDVARLHPTTK